jgi:hypothetical protein
MDYNEIVCALEVVAEGANFGPNRIQVSEHSGNMHAANIQRTFSEHSANIQVTFRIRWCAP